MVDYLAVFLGVKRALVKIVVHSEAFERATPSETGNLLHRPSKTAKRCKKSRNLVLEPFYCVFSKAVDVKWPAVPCNTQSLALSQNLQP